MGIGGSGLAALCCFTPFLPWFLGGLGLSSALGFIYSDAVLLPALAFFLLLTGYAVWRRNQIK
ncbi:MAG: mercury resistance system transport protein MerF [Boseongicola sp.]